MARSIQARNVVSIHGPVRVVKRKDRGYRILWTDGKRQRERTATSLTTAQEIAMEVAADLLSANPHLVRSEHPFGVLVSIATDPSLHPNWSERWAEDVQRLARIHIVPQLGTVAAEQLRPEMIERRLSEITSGYSRSLANKVSQIIGRAVRVGIGRGIWEPGRDPMSLAEKSVKWTMQKPDRRLIPTDAQVEALIESMTADDAQYGLMAQMAAYTGVRWGELLAITRDAIDFDRKLLTVNRTCVEHNDGTFAFTAPGTLKTAAADRKVTMVVDRRRADLLTDSVAAFIKKYRHTDVGASRAREAAPAGRLFYTSTGNPFQRGNWRKILGRHTHAIGSWPQGATWHYLRHYCATRWIRAGVEIPTVSKMIGHSQVSTTMNWYVDTDAESLNRALETLTAFDE